MSGAGVETVTILITDLVGSTKLESRVGPIVAEEFREDTSGWCGRRERGGWAGGEEHRRRPDGGLRQRRRAVSCAVSIQQRFERRNAPPWSPC